MSDFNLSDANNALAAGARGRIIPVEDTRVRQADASEFADLGVRSTTNHQITSEDRLGLYKQAGWHGLGEVIEDGLSGREATRRYLGWAVDQEPVYTKIGGEERLLPLKANCRSDNHEVLGVVGPDYVLIQNEDVGDFADALVLESVEAGAAVRMETCGSLLGGRKVFLTMRADREIRVGRTGADVQIPLLTLVNGHDGSVAMSAFWTMQRVVCNNTMTIALSSVEGELNAGRAFRVRHKGKVSDYLASAKIALGLAVKGLEKYQEAMTAMSERKLAKDELATFFADAYAAQYGRPPENPENEQQEVVKMRADRIVGEWMKLMGDDDQLIDGIAGTLFAAFNCVTSWQDHVRTPKMLKKPDRQNHMKMMGLAAGDKRKAMRVALAAI